jgi:hypothetical protein
MRYFQRKFVTFAASLAFALIYKPLHQFPFAFDLALCVSFTILVFGNAIRRRGFALFSGDSARPLTETILAHSICLVALVFIARLAMYAPGFLPEWLTIPVGADNYGRVGPSAFQILQSLAIFFLGFFEVRVLVAQNTKDAANAKKRASRWTEADLEAQRMSSLRLD